MLEEEDVNRPLQEAVARTVLPENVKLTTHYSDIPPVKLDGNQLANAFTNLIINAVEAMPEGGMLNISTRKTGGLIEIEFKDTGVGIPRKDLEKIFQPFFTTKAKGTGLGLTNAMKTVEAHGGIITVESKEGEGTTVTVKLPVVHPEHLRK